MLDSSSSKFDLSNDSKYSKSKSKGRVKKKKRPKHMKQNLSDSSSSNSDSFNDSEYRRKRRKNKKIHQKKDPIKLCTKITAKLLTPAYKSNFIKFKLDEDLLKRRIYVLTFVESLEIIFPSIKKLVSYY